MATTITATRQVVEDYQRLFVNRRAYTMQSIRPHPETGQHYYFRPSKKGTDIPPRKPSASTWQAKSRSRSGFTNKRIEFTDSVRGEWLLRGYFPSQRINLRRRMPAKPRTPVPRSIMELGSGTAGL